MVANGFEGVAWMIGGGAQHSANVGRVLAYAATSGSEGVIAPGDCKVSPSTTPDSRIHIAVGAVAIRNRYGAASSETYIGRAPQVTDLTVGSTGSSGRSDLVIVRVRDPQFGGQAPTSVANGPYVIPEIISGVPAGTTNARQISALLNEPAYALARIDIPANTTAITSGMIRELRDLALPRSRRMMSSQSMAALPATLHSPDWIEWPNFVWDIIAPSWATHANMRVDIDGILQLGALADIQLRAHLGSQLISSPLAIDNDAFTDGVRHGSMLTAGGLLPTAERGAQIRLKIMGRVIAGDTHPGRYHVDASTHIGFDIQFDEQVV